MKKIYSTKYRIEEQQRLMLGLSMLEKGALRDLEDHYLLLFPDGLPSDNARLYRICGAKNKHEMSAVRYVAENFFSLNEGKLFSSRLDARANGILENSRKQSQRALGRNPSKDINESPCNDHKDGSSNLDKSLNNNDSHKAAANPTLNSYTSNEVLKEREIDKSISLKKTQKTKRDWKADERFLRFREVYPIRPGDSPGIAYEVFLKLVENEGVDHEKIIDGARRYAASRIGESEKFTKHACHWLSPHYRGWELDWTPAKFGGNQSVPASSNPKASVSELRRELRARYQQSSQPTPHAIVDVTPVFSGAEG